MKQLIKNILKEYSINEGTKPHPKEEEFKQYQGIIDDIVYSVVNEDDLCGYRTEFFLNAGEDALQIVLYYKKGRYPGYDVFSEKQIEIKNTLETYLPIIEMAFVSYDSTRCKETIKEDKDTEIEKNLKVINTLLSQVNWEGLCDIWVEYNETDGDYEIRSKYVSEGFYYGDDYFEELEFLDNTIKSMGLRIYIFSPWFVDSCEEEPKFMNESKETKPKYLSVIKDIVEPFKNEDCVCDIDMWYDDEDDMYSVYLIFGTEELNNKFTYDGKYLYIRKKIIAVKEAIKSYLPIDNLNVGSYGKPNCGWNPINESKEGGNKKKSLIKNIRDVGLYDFIRMTGLSLEEVQSQVEKIPREMLEQFIKDHVSNEGSQYSSAKPNEKIVTIDIIVGGNAIIDFIYYDGKVLSFEVTEYANGFSKEDTDQYIEGSKNYGYNTIFKIVEKIIRKIS
jgi:hypothetical protein